MQDEGGSGTRLTDGSNTDEDKLTLLIDKADLDYDTCYVSKMARNKEGLKDVNERTRLCGDDDSLGSSTSVVTNSSEKTHDDNARGNGGSTPPRQPPPVRKVIPKPFRRQKQSFDYGDGPTEFKRSDSEPSRSFDSGDKLIDAKYTNDDPKSEDDKTGDKDCKKSNDPNFVNNGSVKIVDNDEGATEGSARSRRGIGNRDRSKYIYMADNNGRQYSRGTYFCG